MARFVTLLLSFALGMRASAGVLTPYLVRDLNTPKVVEKTQPLTFSERSVGNLVFFRAEGPASGLWRTDGTAAGTHRVYDGMLDRERYYSVPDVTAVDGEVFVALGTPSGNHLYRSDGTTPGTRFITTLFSRWMGGAPCGDGKVCFIGENTDLGVTDGTAEGTSILTSTAPGWSTPPWSWNPTSLGKKAFFNAYDREHGRCYTAGYSEVVVCGELWATDGTAAGTHLFKDLNPGMFPGAPYDFFRSTQGKLYFRAMKPPFEYCQMWVTDGTVEGTLPLVPDARPYTCLRSIWPIVEVREHVYFIGAFGEIFQSRGTPETTVLIWPEQTDHSQRAWSLSAANKTLLISTISGLWSYDGKSFVKVVNDHMRVLGYLASTRRTYFTRSGSIWSTDGTSEGTKELFAFPGDPVLFGMTAEQLYLRSGNELFVTDGSERGTRRLDLGHPVGKSSSPRGLRSFGERIFFTTQDPMRHSVSDGTSEGTTAFANADYESPMFVHEGRLYYYDESNDRGDLWTTDGTSSGTRRVKDWLGARNIRGLPAFLGDTAIFAESDGRQDVLMRSDSGGGPKPLAIRGELTRFATVGNRVSFSLFEQDRHAWAVMLTDGTDAGTQRLASDLGSSGTAMAFAGGAFFGARSKDSSVLSLWVADLGTNGSHSVKTIPASRNDDEILPLLSWRDLAIFAVGDRDALEEWGEVLWRSDGTATGTYPLTSVPFLHAIADGDGLTLIRRVVESDSLRWEIWRSDGTATGTKLRFSGLGRIVSAPIVLPGGDVAIAHLSGPDELHLRNTRTNAATVIALGALKIGPVGYAANQLYFAGCRATTGCELWAVPLAGESRIDAAAVRVEYLGTGAGVDGRVAIFRVTMETSGSTRASVVASTVDGTFRAGPDYIGFSREIVFDEDRDVTLTVPLRSTDASGSMSVVLSSATNATIVNGMATALVGGRRRTVRH